jgi:flagellar basal-body rod modification protein FlgD
MSTIANVVNGMITNQTDVNNKTSEVKDSNSSLDKDAFLQLLVAQMKYQDPLEPTSNTEYISQLATFSELEEMQNVSASVEMQRANELVGEYVFVKTENGYKEGMVDYVVYQGGKVYLSVEEELYSLDDLDTVADSEYLLATRLAESFSSEVNKLPDKKYFTLDDLDEVEELIKVYENMSSYQQSYIADETLEIFKEYLELYKSMKPSEQGEGEPAEGDNA